MFLVVVVDYFTKWVEVEALAKITAMNIQNFLWKSIMCWYGTPHTFVTDNGKQFDCDSFQQWCAKLHIRNYFSRGDQQNVDDTIEEKVRRQEGNLGRFLIGGTMFIQNNDPDPYRRNSILPDFWDQGSNTG
jgi:hypothetical protein